MLQTVRIKSCKSEPKRICKRSCIKEFHNLVAKTSNRHEMKEKATTNHKKAEPAKSSCQTLLFSCSCPALWGALHVWTFLGGVLFEVTWEAKVLHIAIKSCRWPCTNQNPQTHQTSDSVWDGCSKRQRLKWKTSLWWLTRIIWHKSWVLCDAMCIYVQRTGCPENGGIGQDWQHSFRM